MRRLLPILGPIAVLWVIAAVWLPSVHRENTLKRVKDNIEVVLTDLEESMTCLGTDLESLYSAWLRASYEERMAKCFGDHFQTIENQLVGLGRKEPIERDYEQFAGDYMPIILQATDRIPSVLCKRASQSVDAIMTFAEVHGLGDIKRPTLPCQSGKTTRKSWPLPESAAFAADGQAWFTANGWQHLWHNSSWSSRESGGFEVTPHPDWVSVTDGKTLTLRDLVAGRVHTLTIDLEPKFSRHGDYLLVVSGKKATVLGNGEVVQSVTIDDMRDPRIIGTPSGYIIALDVALDAEGIMRLHGTRYVLGFAQELTPLWVGKTLRRSASIWTCTAEGRSWIYTNQVIASIRDGLVEWEPIQKFKIADKGPAKVFCTADRAAFVIRKKLQTVCSESMCSPLRLLSREPADDISVVIDKESIHYALRFAAGGVVAVLRDPDRNGRTVIEDVLAGQPQGTPILFEAKGKTFAIGARK